MSYSEKIVFGVWVFFFKVYEYVYFYFFPYFSIWILVHYKNSYWLENPYKEPV